MSQRARFLTLALGLLCILLSIWGLSNYFSEEPQPSPVTYIPPPPPTPNSAPTITPEPTPVPRMTVELVEENSHRGTWKVFIPEGGKWFDTKIPVVTRLEADIGSERNTQWIVKIGGEEFYPSNGRRSFLPMCLKEGRLSVGLRDTIKIKLEPGEKETFDISVYFTAGSCEMHSLDTSSEHMEIHYQAYEWWEKARRKVGRRV